MTSSKSNHPQSPSLWELGFQHMNWVRGTQTCSPQLQGTGNAVKLCPETVKNSLLPVLICLGYESRALPGPGGGTYDTLKFLPNLRLNFFHVKA